MATDAQHPLRIWRTAKGLSVADAAAQIPVTRQTWHNWERGGSRPPEGLMARIVEMTEGAVTPNDFYPAAVARLSQAA